MAFAVLLDMLVWDESRKQERGRDIGNKAKLTLLVPASSSSHSLAVSLGLCCRCS